MIKWDKLPLKEDENDSLIDFAETVLRNLAKDNKKVSVDPTLLSYRFIVYGCFVSLYHKDSQRACMGVLEETDEVARLLLKASYYSSKHDDRYEPIAESDFNELTLNIWFIRELKKVNSLEMLELGKHGLYVVQGDKSALYLPYVPIKFGWTKDRFLKETCIKGEIDFNTIFDSNTKIKIFETYKLTKEIL